MCKGRKRWAVPIACMGERRAVYRGFDGTPQGKENLGNPAVHVRIILKMDLQEVGCVLLLIG